MPRYSRASPVCDYFDRHLVQVLKALPPLITWSQCHFTDNFTSRRMCQGKRAIRAPGNAEKQLVFSFWKASKGMQSTVRSKAFDERSEEHTSELQSPDHLVCRLLLEKKKKYKRNT